VDRRAQTLKANCYQSEKKQNKTKTKTKKIQNEAMHSPKKPEFFYGKEAKPLRMHFLNRRRISSRCKTSAGASPTAKRERERALASEKRQRESREHCYGM
jgi:hypothetical protein